MTWRLRIRQDLILKVIFVATYMNLYPHATLLSAQIDSVAMASG